MLPGAEILENPPDVERITITLKWIQNLTGKHNLPFDDVLLPKKTDWPFNPLGGYMSISLPICNVGAIPPFPSFIVNFLRRMNLVPMQFHPIACGNLLSLYYLYMRYLGYPPTFDDLAFLFHFKHNEKQSPSLLYFKDARGWKIIEEISSKVGDPRREWFWVRGQPGCA